jgi:cytidine diphosphoramidate kinase
MSRTGTVWWITGLSGAGKSTVGGLLKDALTRSQRAAILLDGDVMRNVLAETAGHRAEDRLRLAMTYGRLAAELSRQGIDVVCATISMFQSVRDWNRLHIRRYREIYLRVPLSELETRDPKGIYRRARLASEPDVVGIDVPFEEPARPDLVIDNFGTTDPEAAAARILSLEAA